MQQLNFLTCCTVCMQVSGAYPCVDRLVHESETIGTCVLLGDGVVLAARHCVVRTLLSPAT
jgi:hypothetical protein